MITLLFFSSFNKSKIQFPAISKKHLEATPACETVVDFKLFSALRLVVGHLWSHNCFDHVLDLINTCASR